MYRGVFGSHVAQVVRRLRRLCEVYGGSPQFVLASATIANPQEFAERLVGLPFQTVEQDGAPHPERTIVFWNPPLEDPDLGTRRSSLAESSYIISEAVLAGARVIGFAPDAQGGGAGLRPRPPPPRRPRPGWRWRARAALPRRLHARAAPRHRAPALRPRLDAVIATSALELGIDVGTLDVALVTGFPGTVTSLASAGGGQAAPDTAGPCWSAARTRSTNTSCASPTVCSTAASRRRSSTSTIRTSRMPTCRARRTSAAGPRRRAPLRRARHAARGGAGAGGQAEAAGRRPGLGQAALARRRRLAALGVCRDLRHRRDASRRDPRHRRAGARLPRRAPRRRLPAPRARLPRQAPST